MKKSHKPKIYLAGGFGSGWQKLARELLTDYEILDPSSHGLIVPAQYTAWDLNAIQECDYVLAYLEARNPGGYALALEIGYANALGKQVLLVEEHSHPSRKRSFDMVREVANLNFSTLSDALEFLVAANRKQEQRVRTG